MIFVDAYTIGRMNNVKCVQSNVNVQKRRERAMQEHKKDLPLFTPSNRMNDTVDDRRVPISPHLTIEFSINFEDTFTFAHTHTFAT